MRSGGSRNGELSPAPRVSVGIPVYNGDRYLARAIESVLTQSYDDLELIVSDNASSDDTRRIAEHYAARDSRVRYLPHSVNRGAVFNWNHVAECARGHYFKWLSANDYLAETAIADCVAALDADPGAVLCFGKTWLIDDQGRRLGAARMDDTDVCDPDPVARFELNCLPYVIKMPLNAGVVRRDALQRVLPLRDFESSDLPFCAALAILGRFIRLPQKMLYENIAPGFITGSRSVDEVRQFFHPGRRKPRRLRHWRLHLAYLRVVLRSQLSLPDRLRCAVSVVRRASWHRAQLFDDIKESIGFGDERGFESSEGPALEAKPRSIKRPLR